MTEDVLTVSMPTRVSDNDPAEIVICLGSSCFARGNSENLAILREYAESPGSKASVRLTGQLCQDLCKEGPNLMIGGKLYHNVTAARLRELLRELDAPSQGAHGTT
jgi:NADH:ubiquinone oxidoreductase subunit E